MRILFRLLIVRCARPTVRGPPCSRKARAAPLPAACSIRPAKPCPAQPSRSSEPTSREERTLVTPALGRRRVHVLAAGPVHVAGRTAGFPELEKTNLSLSASERLSLGDLVLKIGARDRDDHHRGPNARPSRRGARSAARSSTPIRSPQLPTRGRDVFGLMATLPGVVYDGRGSDGIGPTTSPAAFSGTRGITARANIDGVSGNVRSGYQPRYDGRHGRRRRGQGAAEQLPGRVRQGRGRHHQHRDQERQPGVPRLGLLLPPQRETQRQRLLQQRGGHGAGRYRYNTVGGTFGGPVYVPGLFEQEQEQAVLLRRATNIRPSTVPQCDAVLHGADARPSGTATSTARWETRAATSTRPPGSSIR